MPQFRFVAANLLCLMLFAGASAAHEGHDHGAPPPPVTDTIAPRIDASSNDFEIVAIVRGDRLRIYLDTFKTNEPVRDAEIEIDTAAGILKAVPDREGAYEVAAPWLLRPGTYDLAITVQASGLVDVLTATLTVPPSTPPASGLGGVRERLSSFAAGWSRDLAFWAVAALAFLAGLGASGLWRRWRAAAGVLVAVATVALAPEPTEAAEPRPEAATALRDVARRFPDGAVFVPKPTQRILSIRTLFTDEQTYSGTVELPGRIIPDPNASGFVQASVGGRLSPPKRAQRVCWMRRNVRRRRFDVARSFRARRKCSSSASRMNRTCGSVGSTLNAWRNVRSSESRSSIVRASRSRAANRKCSGEAPSSDGVSRRRRRRSRSSTSSSPRNGASSSSWQVSAPIKRRPS